MSLTCYRYSAKNSDANDLLAKALIELSQQHRTWGFGLMYLHLRIVQGKPSVIRSDNGPEYISQKMKEWA